MAFVKSLTSQSCRESARHSARKQQELNNHSAASNPALWGRSVHPHSQYLQRSTHATAQAQIDGLGSYGFRGATAEGTSTPGVALQASRGAPSLRQLSVSQADHPLSAASEETRAPEVDGRACICLQGNLACGAFSEISLISSWLAGCPFSLARARGVFSAFPDSFVHIVNVTEACRLHLSRSLSRVT